MRRSSTCTTAASPAFYAAYLKALCSTRSPLRCSRRSGRCPPCTRCGRIETDLARAKRVHASFQPKLGADAARLTVRCFLSGREDKELLLLRFLHLGYALGPGVAQRMGHPDVAPLYEMDKSLAWEQDKFQGFVRFEEHGGMLCGVIHPKNYILPLLQGHFCARFPEEDFLSRRRPSVGAAVAGPQSPESCSWPSRWSCRRPMRRSSSCSGCGSSSMIRWASSRGAMSGAG